MSEQAGHIPVLLKESVDLLISDPSGVYVDLTYGGGGHSREILGRLSDKGKLIAFDTDQDAVHKLIRDKRFQWIHANFRYLKKYLRYYKIEKVDGVLADLGVSSFHLDEEERGFSFQSDAPLDMRMNMEQEMTAADILAQYPEDKLSRIWSEYAEVTNAAKMAAKWTSDRKSIRLRTCREFAQWLGPFIYGPRNKFLAKVFQGLRIEVNQEMESLKDVLLQTESLMATGGRIVVLSYHSLEDRMVKQFLRGEMAEAGLPWSKAGNSQWRLLNKNVMQASEEEIKRNPRSRSVRLRAAVKI
ncbi:MAG: 16S rRNA (cytosine(1402)-N(4))-methyltransferase RsmH [Saprospiraceae bacterium]|nr:16S rRNA (cytosine(1402)-N(4))-methyltransferase RsmH [Saprospiraceae bacterium]HMW40532.1 16S rRNA (cytosine(1402)-N(4))-methyltransferase RsmH [Saprospiraceae bacterium]HMX89248.1 16S rRNA (cytosine(1402)-N(4))-methyltransferase RsmH [Saprospiraceae bacterium]HMZ41165.1 16S rRNA (cytosine(1402)-N(4))-methyltransferase RsmH [Saprospiraceae bacterium]HNA65063.1 16S rRNA (cytosine(1402)-N(4))-methyltransferase RsmH [Saprospiraceae bacterium]